MRNFLRLFLVTFVLFSPFTHSEGLFSNGLSFLTKEPKIMPVDQAFVLDYQQQGKQLKISFVIADGYYLYKDKLKLTADNATIAEVQLPAGKAHHDEYFGEQEVYYTYLDIPMQLQQVGDDASITVNFMGCAEGKLCFPPTKRTVPIQAISSSSQAPTSDITGSNTSNAPVSSPDTSKAEQAVSQQDSLSQMLEQDNLLLTLLIFFGLGIGLALTPCVFPMYPILSGIIVGQKQQLSTAKAFSLSMAYVQGMAITYSLLGLVVASAGLKYQAALQHPIVLLSLATLFVFLSLSMFGMYDLKLPSRWQDKMNNLANNQKGGNFTGVFMMGVISGLVASPCTTAPLSGALIYVAQSGNLLLGFLTLYVLSMGMGLPLLVLGTSGGKLLPKAGRWMEVIKGIFGFLLLAVAIVMIGRIWTAWLIDVIWSLWGIGLTGYLMHQNKQTQFNWKQTVRSVTLLLSLLASVSYGFQSVMAEFLPQPQQIAEQQKGFIKVKSLADVEKLVAMAAQQDKPVLLDFYADWCVACKEFEKITFKSSEVKQRFENMVLLKANVTNSDPTDIALLEHFSVLGLPTLILFNQQGEQMKNLTVTGFMGPKPFSEHLDLLVN